MTAVEQKPGLDYPEDRKTYLTQVSLDDLVIRLRVQTALSKIGIITPRTKVNSRVGKSEFLIELEEGEFPVYDELCYQANGLRRKLDATYPSRSPEASSVVGAAIKTWSGEVEKMLKPTDKPAESVEFC